MSRVVCCPVHLLPSSLDPDATYLTAFGRSGLEGVGHFGQSLPSAVSRDHLEPTVRAWDFATIACAVDAADKAIPRRRSADGWTRMVDLTVHLIEPAPWTAEAARLSSLLRFLTGDFWTLRFLPGGMEAPAARRTQTRDADCVCLLSGGVDSLVGAIDQTAAGRTPLFVSHIVRGGRADQEEFARALGGAERHLQWSFAVKHSGEGEKSTRARSIVFFAFAALAASAVRRSVSNPVEVVVPENGFISLNVPLGPGRLGSLSTKTTHPVYMSGIQSLWRAVGMGVELSFPYRDKTKGELLQECADPNRLLELVGKSTSCGKYQRHNLTHCGECLPCLVRRAAFLHAGIADTTERGYCRDDLHQSTSSDVAAAAAACVRLRTKGVRRFVGGALSFATHDERAGYEGVVTRGMAEIEALLTRHSVL